MLTIVDISYISMAERDKGGFSSREFVEKLAKRLDPDGDSRTLIDDDAALLYDKLYELAVREKGAEIAQKLTEALIETVIRITLRYRDKSFNFEDLMIGLTLKTKARNLGSKTTSFHEETTNYNAQDIEDFVSTIRELTELLYKLDEESRKARRLDDLVAFLTTNSLLDRIFMPDGIHRDLLSSFSEVFDRVSGGEIFSVI